MDNDSNGTAHSMVLYDNDEVEAVYHDGTCIKLSPCGANVVIPVNPPTSTHPVNLPNQLHQRTQFVTHRHRRKLQLILEFRNRFAEQIFLCQEVLGVVNVVDFYADIKSVSWPTSPNATTTAPKDGSMQLTSTDECATISLAPNRQEFSVRFLCKISNIPQGKSKTESKHNSRVTTLPFRQRLQDISHKLNFDTDVSTDLKAATTTSEEMHKCSQTMSEVKADDSLRRSYAWQIQNYSVDHCPPNWLHPLKILANKSSSNNSGNSSDGGRGNSRGEQKQSPQEDHAKSSKEKTACCKSDSVDVRVSANSNRSDLPRSLPLRCPFSHMHSFSEVTARHREEEERVWLENRRIKVFFSRGVIFRVFWKPQPSLEIYPGDGSLLKSKPGDDDKYFSFFCLRHGNRQEQMLSVKSPPPSSLRCGSHTLSSLLQRGHRLLCHMIFIERNTNGSPENICWMAGEKEAHPLSSTKPAQLLEECQVDGIGHFVAFSNGYIRVIFTDRTTVEFQVDISDESSPLTGSSKKLKEAQHRIRLFQANISRVLLPDGSETVIDLRNPGQMERYTSIASEWATWIALPKSQRRSAYTDTIYDVDKISLVEKELARLRRFNRTDGEITADTSQLPEDGLSNIEVQQVLKRTSAKIKDIDNVLSIS